MSSYLCRPMLEPARCIPSETATDCRNCQRLSGNDAITSRFPVIDASVIRWPEGVCPMREPILEAA